MSETSYLYVVLTSTHSKMGGLIRTVTRYPYNHVSVALEAHPTVLYSFARHYEDAPFYGGFVRESALRYCRRNRGAEALVFAVPVEPAELELLRRRLDEMAAQHQLYLYNTLSALLVPLKRKVALPASYTCVEFAVDVLQTSGAPVKLETDRFYSVADLALLLEDYLMGRTSIDAYMTSLDWAEDTFPTQTSVWLRTRLTAGSYRELLSRLIQSRFTRSGT
ncbi:MAG: hypothetical protein VB023_07945 [Oscillibacter sp.]|nr:hypothetical protein [Oscillibacter sp.]